MARRGFERCREGMESELLRKESGGPKVLVSEYKCAHQRGDSYA